MRLKKDLYSIDKKLLVRAGERINQRVLNKIAKDAKKMPHLKIKNTMISKDIECTLKDKAYKIIFSPKEKNKEILGTIEQSTLPAPVIAELKAIKKRMPYTYHHILIVTILSTKIALDRNIKYKYDAKRMVRLGLVHDIGKSRISPKILAKTTPFTRTERKILKTHPFIGYILLHYYYGRYHSQYDYASYEHHEKLDGSGYPRKLTHVNRYAQLIAVVDILDALISSRPYRKSPYTLRAAIDHLVKEANKGRLNKEVVYLIVSYAREKKPLLKGLRIAKKERGGIPKKTCYGKTA